MRRAFVALLLFLLTQREATAAAAAGNDDSSHAIACVTHLSSNNTVDGFGAEVDDDCLGECLKADDACNLKLTECFQTNCRLCEMFPTKATTGLTTCEAVRVKQAARSKVAAKLLSSNAQKAEAAVIFEALPLSNADCAARVSSGDQGVGLTAIYNADCANGGLGCFSDARCQYCRLASAKTQQFKLCSEISGGGGETPATPPTPSMDCAAAVKNSGYMSANYVVDPSCLAAGSPSGCVVGSTCRLCREDKDEGNQHLALCKVLRDQQALAKAASAAEIARAAETVKVAETTVVQATSTSTTVTATTRSDPKPSPTSTGGWEPVPIVAAAAVGAVIALVAVAIRNSRVRRVANASAGAESGDLHRIDSILDQVGGDRIATL